MERTNERTTGYHAQERIESGLIELGDGGYGELDELHIEVEIHMGEEDFYDSGGRSAKTRVWSGVIDTVDLVNDAFEALDPFVPPVAIQDWPYPTLVRLPNGEVELGLSPPGKQFPEPSEWTFAVLCEVLHDGKVVATGKAILTPSHTIIATIIHIDTILFPLEWSGKAPTEESLLTEQWEIRLTGDPNVALLDEHIICSSYWASTVTRTMTSFQDYPSWDKLGHAQREYPKR